MKELSIEQKAKRYDEAIERAESLYDYSQPISAANVIINNIFPDLYESEDEKIRKALIFHYQGDGCICTNEYRIDYKDIRAWLEKQGEQILTNSAKTCKGEQKHIPKRKIGDTIYYNSFGKVKSMVVADIIIDSTDNPMYEDENGNAVFEKDLIEQNPADKTEPKFKVGDWITDGNITIQIEAIKNDCYLYCGDCALYSTKTADKVYHLWTIQDAKDGDVLYINNTMSESIMIYKSFNNGVINKYASYNKFGFEGENYLTLNDGYIIPATKEQRDTLMKAMADAGYTFDFEKKELKKIEQEQVIDYLDNLPKDNWELVHEFVEKFGRIPKDEDELNVLVEYVLKRQKPSWNEEDEKMYFNIKASLQNASKDYRREIGWFHLLRLRKQWRPSDKQMNALNDVLSIRDIKCDVLSELLKDLKKLK